MRSLRTSCLARVCRFTTLNVQSYWHDEAITAGRVLHSGLGSTLHVVRTSESTPPLYYVLAWLWSKLFGTGEVGLRSLSALSGTLTVLVAYALGRRLVSVRAGLAAASLVAVSPWLVWYSQEARAYSLFILLSGLSMLAFLRALDDPSRERLALWWFVTSLALATHYFAVFIFAIEAAWLIGARRATRAVAIAIAGSAAVGLALLPLALDQASTSHSRWISRIGLFHRVLEVPRKFLIGEHGAPLGAITVAALMLVAVGTWLAVTRTSVRERQGVIIAVALGGAVVGVPLVLSLVGIDYFIARNVSAAWLPLSVALAAGFTARRAGRLGLGTAGALCVALLAVTVSTNFDSKLQRADWRGAAAALPAIGQDRAIVAPFVGDDPLEFYLPHTSVLTSAARVSGSRHPTTSSRRCSGAPRWRRCSPAEARVAAPRRWRETRSTYCHQT